MLGLSVAANLAPKLALLEAYAPSRAAAVRAVATCPALLGYARETRLRPRLDRLKSDGLPFSAIASLATAPDAAFEDRVVAMARRRAVEAAA